MREGSHDANSGECGRSGIIIFINEIIFINDNIMHSCTLFKTNLLDKGDNHDDEERATITCYQFILSYYYNKLISYPFLNVFVFKGMHTDKHF
jgi:hypothetical protein